MTEKSNYDAATLVLTKEMTFNVPGGGHQVIGLKLGQGVHSVFYGHVEIKCSDTYSAVHLFDKCATFYHLLEDVANGK